MIKLLLCNFLLISSKNELEKSCKYRSQCMPSNQDIEEEWNDRIWRLHHVKVLGCLYAEMIIKHPNCF